MAFLTFRQLYPNMVLFYSEKGGSALSVILGIDIGGSTTKIVGLTEQQTIIGRRRVKADGPIASLYGALGSFMTTHQLQLSDISRVVLTGVGASHVTGDIYGIPTQKVEEFTAVGTGGLALSGYDRSVVVSMGTGTAFIWADRTAREMVHLGGSGVGGGTLMGLSSLLCGARQFDLIQKLSSSGDISKIDLSVGDITCQDYTALPLDITAANFGNVSDDATHSDLATGIVNMIFQSIGTTAVMACRAKNCDTVVLTGFMTVLPMCRPCFDLFTRLHGIRFLIPEDATYATSIGAALSSFAPETDGTD